MSYTPQQASLPSRFKKAESNKNSSRTFNQYPKSRIVTIDGYELDSKDPTQGIIQATDNENGRKLSVKINPDKVARNIRSSSDKWNGNLVDEHMEKHIKVGEVVVLERCITEKNIKSGTEVTLSHVRCDWVKTVPDPSPEKVFRAVFTAGAFDDRARGIQRYDQDVRNINPATDEGEKALDELGDRMDEIVAKFKEGERPTPFGVKFHAMVKVDEKDGVNVYQVINKSPPFDWVRAEKDSEENIISEGHPIDKENLEAWLGGYLDYVYGSEDQSAPNAEKGLIKKGVVPAGSDIVVEVMVYHALPCSTLSPQLDISNERTPLARLCNVMSKFSMEDDRLYVGKNWGVNGIIVLTADQPPEKGQSEWKPRNLVTNLFVDGYQADIHTMMKAFDGGTITVHPELSRVRDNNMSQDKEASNSHSNSSSGASSNESATPMLQPAQVSMDDEDDDGGYFVNALRVPNEVVDVKEDVEVVEETVTVTESQEDKDDTSDSKATTDKKASGRGRFARST